MRFTTRLLNKLKSGPFKMRKKKLTRKSHFIRLKCNWDALRGTQTGCVCLKMYQRGKIKTMLQGRPTLFHCDAGLPLLAKNDFHITVYICHNAWLVVTAYRAGFKGVEVLGCKCFLHCIENIIVKFKIYTVYALTLNTFLKHDFKLSFLTLGCVCDRVECIFLASVKQHKHQPQQLVFEQPLSMKSWCKPT